MNKNSFGNYIVKLRKKLGYTQNELGDIIGLQRK